MKSVDWFDLPEIAIEVIDEVERTGESIVITRNGVPALRIDPVDEATQAAFDAQSSGTVTEGF